MNSHRTWLAGGRARCNKPGWKRTDLEASGRSQHEARMDMLNHLPDKIDNGLQYWSQLPATVRAQLPNPPHAPTDPANVKGAVLPIHVAPAPPPPPKAASALRVKEAPPAQAASPQAGTAQPPPLYTSPYEPEKALQHVRMQKAQLTVNRQWMRYKADWQPATDGKFRQPKASQCPDPSSPDQHKTNNCHMLAPYFATLPHHAFPGNH